MRVLLVIAAVAIGTGLAGCEMLGDPKTLESDGPRCDFPGAADRVHIEIRYGADGTPAAVPDECTVRPGTRITWVGPERDARPFALAFPGGSPAARGEGDDLTSDRIDEREKVVLVAGDIERRYKYEIDANGITVDPAIIINR
jgi:hypothetical protein